MHAYDVAFYLPSLGPLLAPAAELPSEGGAETQVWLLSRGLADQGYKVCVVVSDVGDGLPHKIDGVSVVLRDPSKLGRGWSGKLAELRALWRCLGQLDAEVIVQRTAGIGTGLVGVIAKLKRRKFVYSSANVMDFEFEKYASSAAELRLFNLGVRLARTIVVQTQEQAELCQAKFGRSATTISSIAEPAAPRVQRGEAFLWVGRLVDYKRPEAFLDLARALPEARFWMVGLPSPDAPQLRERIELEAARLPNVEVLSPLPRPRLLSLYDKAVAVVNTADCEGMPNVFLEAWSRGVPALALSHDPDGVIARYRLGAFAHGSPREFADAARRLWSADDERAGVAARCRDYVRREHGLPEVVSAWASALGLSRAGSRCAVRDTPLISLPASGRSR